MGGGSEGSLCGGAPGTGRRRAQRCFSHEVSRANAQPDRERSRGPGEDSSLRPAQTDGARDAGQDGPQAAPRAPAGLSAWGAEWAPGRCGRCGWLASSLGRQLLPRHTPSCRFGLPSSPSAERVQSPSQGIYRAPTVCETDSGRPLRTKMSGARPRSAHACSPVGLRQPSEGPSPARGGPPGGPGGTPGSSGQVLVPLLPQGTCAQLRPGATAAACLPGPGVHRASGGKGPAPASQEPPRTAPSQARGPLPPRVWGWGRGG